MGQIELQVLPGSGADLARLNADHAVKQRAANVARLEKAIEVDPKDFVRHHSLALEYLKLDRPAEARAQVETALRINPDYAEAHHTYGTILMRDGKPDLDFVERQYRDAVRLKPDAGLRSRAFCPGAAIWPAPGAITIAIRLSRAPRSRTTARERPARRGIAGAVDHFCARWPPPTYSSNPGKLKDAEPAFERAPR
jgi:Tfp pilus assembly protein PilF